MPGIVGVVGFKNLDFIADRIDQMLAAMSIEPYYRSCQIDLSEKGIYLGSVALPETQAAASPIQSKSKNTTLLLSGEVLSIDGQSNSPKDTNTIIANYEDRGIDSLAQLNGWFSGVILDHRTDEVILFNDRYGMQRIYYYEADDYVAFASEAKSLLYAFPSLRKLNMVSMGEYLTSDCVFQNRTFFDHISLMPGGSAWILSGRGIQKESYFDPKKWENQEPLKEADAFYELGKAFVNVLPDYFKEEPTGFAFTGGLDTRMILSGIIEKKPPMHCFTFGGPYRESFDVHISRRVSQENNIPHKTFYIGNDYLGDYPQHVARAIYAADGQTDVTTADENYLNRKARDISQAKVTGKFGSQILRGVTGLRIREPNSNMINAGFIPYLQQAKETFGSFRTEHPLSRFLFKGIPWYWSRYTVPELQQVMVRSPYLDNRFVKMLYRMNPGFNAANFQMYCVRNNCPDLYGIMTDKGFCGGHTPYYLIQRMYYKFFTMADKVYSWDQLPYGLTHPISRLDCLLRPLHLDAWIRGRSLLRHYRIWFREELSDYVQSLVLDPRTLERPYWNPDFVKTIVDAHIKGKGNYLTELRKIMTIELIHRVLVEDIDPEQFH